MSDLTIKDIRPGRRIFLRGERYDILSMKDGRVIIRFTPGFRMPKGTWSLPVDVVLKQGAKAIVLCKRCGDTGYQTKGNMRRVCPASLYGGKGKPRKNYWDWRPIR